MKKYIAIFLFTVFAFTTVACGSGTDTSSTTSSNTASVGKFTGGSQSYALKDGKIFWFDYEVIGANPDDFKVVSEGDANGDYAISSKAVYHEADVIPGVSSKGFTVLNGTQLLYKDSEHVYIDGEVQEGLDAQTYKILSDTFTGVDKNGVYSSFTEKIEGADPKTFKLDE